MCADWQPPSPVMPDALGLPPVTYPPQVPNRSQNRKDKQTVSSLRIENARLRWQEDGRPYASDYEDVFFTRGDEIAESQHVFITANRLQERWARLSGESRTFSIGELGFGCTLNFLNTWRAWREFKSRHPDSPLRLHYVAVEKHPLRHCDLERVYKLWPELQELSSQLLALYPDHSTGCHRLWPQQDITLDIHYGDALELLRQFAASATFSVACWYADGFSPRTNPDLWQGDLFQVLADCSSPGATLSTYSAAGAVKRALQDSGFEVVRSTGFGSKRHMLTATLGSATGREQGPEPERHVTIVGAGLAGSALACSLARRGWRVTVLDAGNELPAGASGSGQLNLRCHLVAEASPLARFYLQSFLFARRQFELLSIGQDFWHPTALVQLDSALRPETKAGLADYKKSLLTLYADEVLTAGDAASLSETCGVTVGEDGVLFPLGGWVEPRGLLEAYLQHPNITLLTSTHVARFDYQDDEGGSNVGGLWQCYDQDNMPVSKSPYLALCTGSPLGTWEQTRKLPLQAVRGQNTFIRHPELASRLRSVLCASRTVFPAHGDTQTVSASYQRDNDSLARNEAEDSESLALLGGDIRQPDIGNASICGARVAMRYNSIDHAPIVGPIPDWEMSAQRCEQHRPRPGELHDRLAFHRGLYISTAHASSGLATCALAGEYLASVLCAEPSPIGYRAMQQLSATRFLLRDLKKRFL